MPHGYDANYPTCPARPQEAGLPSQAEDYMSKNDEAQNTLRAMIEVNPSDTALYYRLERLQIWSGDWRGASETINRLAEIAPEETEAMVGRGLRAVITLCVDLCGLVLLAWVIRTYRPWPMP
jgi:hypothetical protein